jgi:hypothetical protein
MLAGATTTPRIEPIRRYASSSFAAPCRTDLKTEAEAAATASLPCTVEGVRRGIDQIVGELP